MLLQRGILLNNRYRIIEILGQGGMGSVYKAVDENLGVEVAVKDNLFTTDEYARQFRREAVLLATLRHSNLPRVTDHFVIDGQGQYLVMDYIDGEDLRQRMDRVGPLPDSEVIMIGAAICDALTYLSNCNPPIVHRDIKPGNVRITPQGHIYLVDFGLAKDLRSHQTTTTGARAMTPGYSPPEQYGTARTDQRSDIYSLGATLYAASTGLIPEDALSRAVDHVELTQIRRQNPHVSKKLAAVIEKALDIRPDGRYQTADDFKQALLNAGTPSQRDVDEYLVAPPPGLEDKPQPGDHVLVSSEAAIKLPRPVGQPPILSPPREYPTPGASRNGRPKRKSSSKRVILLIIVILLLTSVAVALYTVNPTITNRALMRIVGISAMFPPFRPTSTAGAIITPEQTDKSSLVAVGANLTTTPSPQPSSTSTQTSTSTSTTTPTPSSTPTMTATATETQTPTFTPTPQPTLTGGGAGQIAFASDRDTRLPQIWLMDTDGNIQRRLTNIDEGACQPEWSPNGKQLIFISPCERNKESYPGSGLILIPDVDAEQIETIPLPHVSGGDFDPAWSPDGTKIAFTSTRDTNSPRIFEMNLSDKSVKVITPLFVRTYQPAWSPSGQEIAYVQEDGFGRIVIRKPDGDTEDLVDRPAATSDVHPTWSPDGNVILFTRYPAQNKPPNLMSVYLDQFNDTTALPVYTGPIPMREAKYSPDGLWLVFENWPSSGNHEIAVMTTTGTLRRNLTDHPRNDFDASWRPALP